MTQAVAYERPEPFTVPEGGLASFLTATVGDWADDDDYTPIPSSGIAQVQQVADKLSEFGRNEDTYMVHAAEGETVIPTAIFDANPKLKATLFKQMEEMGLEPERYVIGNELNSLNPVTGQPEFFFKKIFKGIKKAVKGVVKVFKKIAPVVLPIALGFTPLGPIFGPMVGSGIASLIQGKSLGKSLKSALISGAVAGLGTGLAGGFKGLKPGGVGFGEGFTSSIGNALSSPGARFSALGRGLMPGSNAELFSTKYLTADPSTFGQAGANPTQVTPVGPSNQVRPVNMVDGLPSGPVGPNAQQISAGPKINMGPVRPVNMMDSIPSGPITSNTRPLSGGTGFNVGGSQVSIPSSTTGGITGAGESRNFLQRTGDYLTGGSPADVELMKKAAGEKYVANMRALGVQPTAAEISAEVAKAGPSMLRKYGPSAAIGTGLFSLAGGFKVPEEEEIERGPTGEELYAENPEAYGYMDPRTYASTYNAPNTYSNVYVPTLYAAGGGEASFPRRMGAISGPGTGTSDDVPAMLSDGEFVMTADAVRGAGGGSRQRGMNNMYAMMRRFEGGAV
jgi:hypothetical protein